MNQRDSASLTTTLYMAMPSTLSVFWNFGSLLGLCLSVQLISGLGISMHYLAHSAVSFESVIRGSMDVSWVWLGRVLHANGASLFFVMAFLHMGRGLYYSSYRKAYVWLTGVACLGVLMITSFLGYVLPWGQMSLWGATVITNLVSVVPWVGEDIVTWVWGGYAVSGNTLPRFFSLHFLLPWVLAALVASHVALLHQVGSSNPTGISESLDKVPFHPNFTVKDMVGVVAVMVLIGGVMIMHPWVAGDPENFIESDNMKTPLHIKPEWYFLFAYAILRSVPNKVGGVVGLVASVGVFSALPLLTNNTSAASCVVKKSIYWCWVAVFLILSWVGGQVVEEPFMSLGQGCSVLYFALLSGMV